MEKIASQIQIGDRIKKPLGIFSDFRVNEIKQCDGGYIAFFGISIDSDRDVLKVNPNRFIEVLDGDSSYETFIKYKNKLK